MSAGVVAAQTVGLVFVGERGRVRERVELTPFGGAQGAGPVLRGLF